MKKVREQAKREKKALKSSAKANAKAMKELAANAVDDVVAEQETVTQNAEEVKDSIEHLAHAVKVEIKVDFEKAGELSQEKGKAAKAFAVHAMENVAEAQVAVVQKAGEMKDSITYAAHTVKTDVQATIQKDSPTIPKP